MISAYNKETLCDSETVFNFGAYYHEYKEYLGTDEIINFDSTEIKRFRSLNVIKRNRSKYTTKGL